MIKVSSNLTDIAEAGVNTGLLEPMIKAGWKFWLSTWEDRHKNDQYHELNFQSPRMKKHASIHPSFFDELTWKSFEKREAFAVSIDWADNLFHDKSVIQNPLSAALREYFAKTDGCKFSPLYATSIDFKVKVNPKNKTTPKKVKVSITIE